MTNQPWWRTEAYSFDVPLPPFFTRDHDLGPRGTALVRAWPDGRTDAGWGLEGKRGSDGFMRKYWRGEFNARRILYGFERGKWNFAIVMRSVPLVCIDIDGKNGGLEHAKRLGMLPPTMAETSKSGDGYHLFYSTDEVWDRNTGFAQFSDRIGLEQGVDIRAVGCVYHHPQQRWNTREAVLLPQHLKDLLLHRQQKQAATSERITKILGSNDELEVLMLHDEILTDLAKPIPSGKRNNTLFAIGNQMHQANISGWEDLLRDRAQEVGLPQDETDKLVANIQRYGQPTP